MTGDRAIKLQVGYSWTTIFGADDFFLRVLDSRTKYPTPVADAREAGVDLYDEDGNPITWDGYIRLLKIRKTMPPAIPTGLLHIVQQTCQEYGHPCQTEDSRIRPEPGMPEFKKFELRDYQKTAVREALRVGYGVLNMPPRSGKTRAMMEIHRCIALPTAWVVPTDRIAKQTLAVAEEAFGKNYATHLIGSGGQDLAANLRLVIFTAATANSLGDIFWKSRQVLIVDEFHHCSAKSYRDFAMKKCDHIFHKYGMTGTHFRSGNDALAMHAIIGNVVFGITSTELKDMGFLVPTDVLFVPIKSNKIRIPGSDSSFISGHGKYGIHEHEHRNQLVANAAAVLAKSGKKVLVLVGTKAQGREVLRFILPLLPEKAAGAEFDKAEFVSTDSCRPKIDRILDSYNTLPDEVQILIGTSLVGEGVDLPSADALVYARGEKAEVSLIQAAYRVCTAVPGKERAVIVDFADRHHRKLMAHSKERLEAYFREPIFQIQVLDGMDGFVSYLGKNSKAEVLERNSRVM